MFAHPAISGRIELPMRILAISGSLRAQSRTQHCLAQRRWLLRRRLTSFSTGRRSRCLHSILIWISNLDLRPVSRFRAALRDSSAVIFSTPEYAHGIPGSLRNALDWVVGSGELSGKPVALLNASARGQYAKAALRETLRTMDARVISDAEVTVPLLGKGLGHLRLLPIRSLPV
jgi:chromate reductase